MAPDERKSCRRHTLKKGPWTSSEDMILVEYVKKHGEGNWNAVQRNSGLMRCGKSCRLRWANHLRPNLKKGAFSVDEEKLIVDLHAKLGNKWARMAAQLPGRTDNEIKNYWNTRLKRRQRAGLPIYPQEAVSAATKQEQQLDISTSQSPTTTTNLNYFSYINSPVHDLHHLKLYRANNGGSLSLSNIIIPASFSTGPYFNLQGKSPLMSSILHQHNNSVLNYGGYQYQMGFLGLPSIQSSSATTSSITDGADQDYHDQVEVEPTAAGFSSQRSKSGLLEDLLGESQALGCHQEPEDQDVDVPGNEHQKAFGNLIGNGNSKSDDNDYEGQENKGPREGMTNCMDDDLLNLLDNFPLSVPIPDWNNDQGKGSESPFNFDRWYN